MAKKITETGPVGLKGIRNSDLYGSLSSLSQSGDEDARALLSALSSNKSRPYSAGDNVEGYYAPVQYEEKTPYATLGESQYDKPYIIGNDQTDVNEIRYENQPWYDVLANGVGKMFGRAGTTFVSSLVGLPYGLFEAVKEENASKLWDNDVAKALSDVDKWMEENMTNYKSQEQQQDPTFRLGDLNWWADNVITNAGFTLGAAASMAVGSGAMGLMGKALGFVNDVSKTTKGGAALLSSLFSATGEGMIEAKQGVEERNKLEYQKLDDAFAPEKAALDQETMLANQEYAATRNQSLVMGPDGRAVDPAYERYKQKMLDIQAREQDMQQRYNAGKQQIEESGKRMGNTILGLNQVLLSAGNMIQFGKAAVKSFDAARHASEMASKAAKPFGVRAVKAGTDLLRTGYKISGKNLGRTIAATKGLITEGSEEMNQQWIQSGSGAYYNEKNANDYWKAKLDPEAYRETTEGLHTWGNAISQGFKESWLDKDQLEQFLIGGMTGMAGSYAPTKIFNQDKTKSRWDPRRYGEWSGGAFTEVPAFNKKYQQYQENIDDLNKILQSEDFPARVKSMVGHTYMESQKDIALDEDNKKAWKDADDKQAIHDMQAFVRAGKVDDLRAIYNEMSSNLSDEDIENIIKSTTREISAEEDKQYHDRQVDERIAVKQREVDSLYDELEALQNSLLGSTPDAYDVNRNYVNEQSQDILQKISTGEEEINALNQQKQNYVGQQGRYEGYYVDDKGNRTASYDKIREGIKHNAEELNRKLDSYLDSIDQVNKDTKGALTKDQEDNLAYLHNLGKESLVRADKIISDKRKQMPSKFLMKTNKTPEQLTKEYASSDLVFNKDENTKEGYVEVDTSLMDDRSFRNFFIGELLWGGNINPEFGETADEKALREEEEKNLSSEEKKKRARERASKKWQEALEQQKKDAVEQASTNGDLISEYFTNNYLKNNNANQTEVQGALNEFFQDIIDASSLVLQAGEYDKTLREYMANPTKVDEDKAKAEEEAQKANDEQQAKNQFAGKSASEIKQDIANGDIDLGDLDAFINDGGIQDEELVVAQQEAKKAQEGNKKSAALKQHIMESEAEPEVKEMAMAMVDQANMQAESPEEINMESEAFKSLPIDMVDPDANPEEIARKEASAQEVLAYAFNSFNEDEVAQSNIPDNMQQVNNDVEAAETGDDPVTKLQPEVVAPTVSSPSAAANEPLPKNPLTEGDIDTIKDAISKVYNKSSDTGTWRSTTTRYGKYKKGDYWEMSNKPYYQLVSDKESLLYKRSKAIWEYFNEQGVFDRQDDSSNSRIREKDIIHFVVKNMSMEIFGKSYKELTTEEKPVSLVIMMMNENGEILGDLPLAQWEPTYKSENPSKEVKDLLSLQDLVFAAYDKHLERAISNDAIVDALLHKEGFDNLNLTFKVGKKPLLSKVKQVMRGAVPYRKSEINTLNEVAQGTPMELGVSVTGTTVAKKRGDKTQHKEIVMPRVGTTGQPYLLMPTPSGEQIAVPFYMKPFDANQHRNTEMYKLLTNAIYNILTNNTNKEVFKKNMDVIEGLLQVKVADGVKNAVDVRKDLVTMHLQSLIDANNKIEITVPFNQNTSELAMAMVDQFSGIPINVSLQFLNDTIEAGGRKANYNNVIGEIADVNLPKATTHTINSWFTVELAPSAGIKPSKKVTPRTTGVITENIGGKSIEINTDALVAYDPTTGEVILDNEEVNLRLAQIKAAKPQYQDKDRIQVSINGELRTYDTKENKFVKNAPIKKETIVTSQPAAEGTPNVPEVATSTPEAVSSVEPQTPTQPQTQSKTIEQIESEMKQKKIVGRQTKDAWDAIPNDLKLKMVNEGQPLQLSFNGKTMVVSLSDREGLIQGLTQANMAAKAGNLTVSEAPKYRKVDNTEQKKANIQREKRWLQKNLPMFSSEERLKLIQGLIEIPGAEGWAWGRFQAGVITLSDMAAAGTTYHEAFHAVTQTLLDDEELNALYEAAKERYKENDIALVEELLAEDFRKYVQREETPIIGFIRKVFRRIMHAMRNLDSYRDPINLMFYKINNGEFKDTLPRVNRGDNAFYRNIRTDRMLDKSHPMHKAIEKAFNAKDWNGDFNAINRKWKQFKSAWQAEGYTPVMQNVYNKDGKGKVVFLGVRTNADEAISLRESRQPKVREQYAAQQAREGGIERLQWSRLTPEQQMNLMNDGMTEDSYNQMALEEKDQWVKCRA